MQFETFCNKVMESLSAHFYEKGVEVEINLHDVCKNNGVILKGICIREPGKKVAPNIYLNNYYQLYENGAELESILDRILLVHEEKSIDDFDMEYFTNFDRVRDGIVYKLIHYEKNSEMLLEVPHMRYLDMAVVFYYLVSKASTGNASILIKQEHLNMWKVSKDDVFRAAAVNTPKILGAKIASMESIVTENCLRTISLDPSKKEDMDAMMDDISYLEENHPSCMYILSNETNLYGAACVLYRGVLKKFAERIHSNLFVLPSSVHEMILIPASVSGDPKELAEMVREINHTAVEREEVLSDHVYYYDRVTDQMELCA